MIRLNEQKIADEMERRTRSDQTKRNLESEIRNCKHELQKIDSQLQKNNSIERNYTKQLDDTRKDLGKFLSILIGQFWSHSSTTYPQIRNIRQN